MLNLFDSHLVSTMQAGVNGTSEPMLRRNGDDKCHGRAWTLRRDYHGNPSPPPRPTMSSSSLGEEGASDYPVNAWTEAIMLAIPLQLAVLTVLSVIASQLRLNYWLQQRQTATKHKNNEDKLNKYRHKMYEPLISPLFKVWKTSIINNNIY